MSWNDWTLCSLQFTHTAPLLQLRRKHFKSNKNAFASNLAIRPHTNFWLVFDVHSRFFLVLCSDHTFTEQISQLFTIINFENWLQRINVSEHNLAQRRGQFIFLGYSNCSKHFNNVNNSCILNYVIIRKMLNAKCFQQRFQTNRTQWKWISINLQFLVGLFKIMSFL